MHRNDGREAGIASLARRARRPAPLRSPSISRIAWNRVGASNVLQSSPSHEQGGVCERDRVAKRRAEMRRLEGKGEYAVHRYLARTRGETTSTRRRRLPP